jgi:prevent-host-death family protein
MQAKQRNPTRSRKTDAPAGALPVWNLQDAKAHFSELVRQARDRGPQRVTVRGQDAVVVVSAAEYARLAPAASKTTLAALFAEGPFSRLDEFEENLVRERAPSRDLPEF